MARASHDFSPFESSFILRETNHIIYDIPFWKMTNICARLFWQIAVAVGKVALLVRSG